VARGGDGRERIYVSLSGIYPGLLEQELSGGVVVVDGRNRVVERLALDDDAVGGNLSALAVASERLAYVVVSDASFLNRVVAFDPSAGEVLRTVRESMELIPDLAVDSTGLLAVPERNFFGPQICLYREAAGGVAGDRLVGCIPTELPPFSVEALD
jgi:hypothetical protein